jgi:RHS repeat-associated protein
MGKGWIASYERKLNLLQNGTLTARRPDGREWFFRIPASGNIYPSDSDVNDKLERLVDGVGSTSGWKLSAASDDETELYDTSGKLLSITSRTGLVQLLSYSDSSTPPAVAPAPGLLIRISDPFGRQLNFTYDAKSRVKGMNDPVGGQYSFEYDGVSAACSTPQPSLDCFSFNLTKITFPDTKTRTFFYNETARINGGTACSGLPNGLPNQLTGITDENSQRFANYEYDCQGRATRTEHAGGAEANAFTYNLDGTTVVTDARGTARTFAFQNVVGVARNTGISQPCEHCTTNIQAATYDATGNRASQTDWNGNNTCYKHDTARNLEIARGEGLNGLCPPDVSTWTPTAGTEQRKVTTEWHSIWRLPNRVAEPTRITTFVYNGDGGASCGFQADGLTLVPGVLCSKTVQATTDATGAAGFGATLIGVPRTWSYTYNANGQVLSATGPRTDVVQVTNYAYYPNNDPDTGRAGQLMTLTNPLGHVTTIDSYNLNGQPTQITDPNGTVSVLSYRPRGWLASRRVGTALAGELTVFDYDGAGQLKTITFPDLSTLTYTYDAAHRLTDITDKLGNKITYTPDAMGNRTREDTKDPLGTLVKTLSRVYNSLNRLSQLIGAQPNELTEYTLYDGNGNLKQKQERLAHTPAIVARQSDYGYDALNRLITMLDGASPRGTTSYAYDGLDQLTRVTDPRNNATGYTVDGLGNLTQVSSPDTGALTRDPATGFDAAGNVKIETDAEGRTRTYTYDALDRVTQVVHTKTGLPTVTVGFGYDQGINGKGRLTTMSDPSGSTAWEYDLRGRVTKKTQTVAGLVAPFVVQYHYDAAGRMDSLTYPSATALSYGFDANGRVSDISKNTTPATPLITSAAYFPFGAVRTFLFGNNQAVIRSFDSDGRLSGHPLSDQTRVLAYDDGARITLNQKPDATDPRSFGYDALDRLTSYIAPGTSQSFGYDANGNRASQAIGADTNTYNYAAGDNRLASVVSSAGSKLYSYDASGNQTGVSGLQVHSYAYDARGRMISADNQAASYLVNGLGQRVQKTLASPASTTFFVYDEERKLIGEYDASGAPVQELVYLNDLPVASLRGADIYYMYADQLNTPRQITNATNQLVWRWDSDPFGLTPADENPLGLGPFSFNLRFPGQYFDRETNLAYNMARDYDSNIGRYIQSDPVGIVGGLNTYAYVDGNPISRVDPLGLWSVTFGAFSGTGAQVTFGQNPNGSGFMSFQFGFGAGGGIKYDPLGQQPGYSPSQGNSWGLGLGLYGQASFNAGPVYGGLGANLGRNFNACGSDPYGTFAKPSVGLRGQLGISATASTGGQITIFGGGTPQ